jgi:predicted dehydrogenase
MSTGLTRRTVLQAAGGIAAGLTIGRTAVAAPATMGRSGANDRITCAVIGVGNRGSSLLSVINARKDVDVVAVCDLVGSRVQSAQDVVEKTGRPRPEGFDKGPLDYRRLLERKDIDAVVVATPMADHARMSIDALSAGKAALSEVAAATTLDDCWGLVRAVEQTGGFYMMAENVCYYRDLLAVLNMVRKGVFGELTYGECGYVHDCRYLDFTPEGGLTWRGEQTRDEVGNRYPTHSLGPMARFMDINGADRFISLVSMSSRALGPQHYAAQKFGADSPAAKMHYKRGDTNTTLIRTAKGAVIDLRYDTGSNRPHHMTTYHNLQGEKASFQSWPGEVWIEGRSKESVWEPFSQYVAEYDHPWWKESGDEAAKSGHGGADYFVMKDFFESLRAKRPSPIDVYDAVVWSAIMPLSAESVTRGSVSIAFPDFLKNRRPTASRTT